MQLDVSIIIASWNDCPHLRECLESLEREHGRTSIEVIVVDNASEDGSPEMVEREFPAVRLIRNGSNLGFSKANNIGIKASTGRYIYLVNSDIKALDGCIEKMADFLDSNPRAGIAGPRILNADLSLQCSCRRDPGLWNNFCSATGLARLFRSSRLLSGEQMFYFKGDRIIEPEVLVGCFWAARREAVKEFGLLDEGFFMYGEDLDWCKRCRRAGWKVVFFPGASAIHYRAGSSVKQDPAWVAVTQQRSVLRYWRKHHGPVGRLLMGDLILVHKTLRLCAALVAGWRPKARRDACRVRARVNVACLKSLLWG